MTEARTYLIAYDIRSPGRLKRVYKLLTSVGYRLQYSVFAVDLTDGERQALIARLTGLLNQQEDDVRFYLVPIEPRGDWQGALPADDAIQVMGSPAATLPERLSLQGRSRRKGR